MESNLSAHKASDETEKYVASRNTIDPELIISGIYHFITA